VAEEESAQIKLPVVALRCMPSYMVSSWQLDRMNQAFDVIFGRSVDRGAIWVLILTIGSDGEKILANTGGKIVVFIEAEMKSNYSEIAKEQQKSILMDIK
jgi:hypothetical protein